MEAKFVPVRGLWRPPSSLPPSSLPSLLPLDGFGSPYPTVATGHSCVFQNNVYLDIVACASDDCSRYGFFAIGDGLTHSSLYR